MPLFEYQCQTCEENFEKRVSFSESDVLPECPQCGSIETRKKISVFATGGGVSFNGVTSTGSGCGSSGGFS
ncbi:MAG: zinc ribbon domain-containing protein [Anaerolineaceae bacterium]|nr:zinc ribbon domain-containing protein [Anaerolineaceae bacterium]